MFADQTRVRVSHFLEKVRDKQIFGEKNCENTCLKLLKVSYSTNFKTLLLFILLID
jgi:hypothetical protein